MAQPVILPQEDVGYSRIMLELINLYRMENGLNPLQLDPLLVGLAKNHSSEMFLKEKVNHRNFDERLEQARSRLCVENVGWNYGSPHNMLNGWRRSSDHNHNLLQEGINRVGIAEIGQYVTFFACQ